jgi:hypothetical protein
MSMMTADRALLREQLTRSLNSIDAVRAEVTASARLAHMFSRLSVNSKQLMRINPVRWHDYAAAAIKSRSDANWWLEHARYLRDHYLR